MGLFKRGLESMHVPSFSWGRIVMEDANESAELSELLAEAEERGQVLRRCRATPQPHAIAFLRRNVRSRRAESGASRALIELRGVCPPVSRGLQEACPLEAVAKQPNLDTQACWSDSYDQNFENFLSGVGDCVP